MKIYPVAGRIARDPSTFEPVPTTGKTVSDYDPFWLRRLSDGDVTETAPTDPESSHPEASSAPAASGGEA